MFTGKRKILIFIGVGLLVVLVFVWLYLRGRETTQVLTPTPSPAITPFPSPIYFDSSKYQGLIYEDPQKNFQIAKIASTGEYQISILGSPFATYRTQAENAFLVLLKISKEEACKLNVTIGTPYFANPDESGKIYPLSFCP